MKTKLILALAALISGPALAQDFPQEITHKYGTIEIPAKPERVASLDFAGIDNLLALGVQPVAVRFWYRDQYELAAWPWAQEYLTTTPEVLKGELNFEQVARSNPDVIIGIASGISDGEYAKLSQIAPVVAVPEGYPDYGGLSWDERVLIAAGAIGLQDEAEKQIQQIKDRIAQIKADHPEWQGKTVAVGFHYDGKPGAYTSSDRRPLLLAELGFVTPPEIDAAGNEGDFYVSFSPEDMSPMDTDLLIWFGDADNFDKVLGMPARPFLEAHKDGREVFLGDLMSGAFSHASLLSLNYALDRLVPMIEAALDGDPATNVDDLQRD